MRGEKVAGCLVEFEVGVQERVGGDAGETHPVLLLMRAGC